MEVLIYLLAILTGLFMLVLIIGLCLPPKKVHSRQTIFGVPPKIVFNIVTDNANWQHRKDLKDLKIISIDGYKQIWEEYTNDGQIIQFVTRDFIPYSFYSFDMESKFIKGYWTSEYKETEDRGTLYIATEHITCKTPFIRIFNCMFFDMDKYMEKQELYLKSRIEETNQDEAIV